MNTETNKEVFVTGLTTDETEPVNLEEIETKVASSLDNINYKPYNRAQRRAMAKKMGKKGREQFVTISETARKLTYVDLIQKIRNLNEENEKNEQTTTEDC